MILRIAAVVGELRIEPAVDRVDQGRRLRRVQDLAAIGKVAVLDGRCP